MLSPGGSKRSTRDFGNRADLRDAWALGGLRRPGVHARGRERRAGHTQTDRDCARFAGPAQGEEQGGDGTEEGVPPSEGPLLCREAALQVAGP